MPEPMPEPMPDIRSRPYRPGPAMACPACVWGRGAHAEFCSLQWGTKYLQIPAQDLFPGWKPSVREHPSAPLYVSKIDHKAKTVTLSTEKP